MSVKLNIGAGDTKIEGFTPIDRKLGSEAYPLSQYADNSVDELRASHILEHFGFTELDKVLKEWVRVLKPGGRIRIAVPDVDKVLAAQDSQERLHWLMGGQTDENDIHKSAFTCDTLTQWMKRAGIGSIQPWESENTDCASLPISLNLQGVKPPPPQTETLKIAALMSIPRVGWNDAWGCIHESLRPFNIPVHRFQGVFWGQCMQRGLEEMVANGADWVLCIDYDTVFSPEHLDTLLGSFGNHPEIDALASIQSRRQNDTPLMTCGHNKRVETDGQPIKVTTANFGLTLIRLECLADVQKPWFKSEPDAKGEWGDDHLDDDIWFWHVWRKAGKNIYVEPNARIGHLELMVSQFDEAFNHQLVTVPEWRDQQKCGVAKNVGSAS